MNYNHLPRSCPLETPCACHTTFASGIYLKFLLLSLHHCPFPQPVVSWFHCGMNLLLQCFQQVLTSLAVDVNNFLGIANIAISLAQKVSEVNGVKAKKDILEMNMRLLSDKKADISLELEQEEGRPGKRRKREVDSWIQSVRSMEGLVRELGQKVEEGDFFSHLMLVDLLSGLATQVEKLHEKGRFADGLTQDVRPDRGYKLQPGELVGQDSQTKKEEILDCLMKEEVLRVGVWGQRGVGKTFLAKHIHDQIVQDCPRYDGACLVTVSQDGTVGTIQTDIANYLKLDMTEVRGVYWGARLKEALQGRKLLLILDDVWKYYPLEEVGIALERNGCKLIVTSRSREVCEQMNCHKLVHVATLPEEVPQGLEEVSKLESEGLGKLKERSWVSEGVAEFDWEVRGAQSSVVPSSNSGFADVQS